jgi:inhibitor of nuclear factor kappa-B kinase subunit alpha
MYFFMIMGRLTVDDRNLIWNLRTHKRWGSSCMIKEFPNKTWKRRAVDYLIKKIDTEGTTARKPGSGRPKSVRTDANVAVVSELICSQEDQPHSHLSPREIERQTGISRSSVRRIVMKDLALNQYKRIVGQQLNANCMMKRLDRSRQLLQRFPTDRSVRSIWFTDEKVFTVETPVNSQNDRVYAQATRKRNVPSARLIRERQHFSRSVMVSVGVSRLGKTRVIFIEPGAKVNSDYYCQRVLGEGLLADIRTRCQRYTWTLQQDGAPSHTAKTTLAYLQRENVKFIEPDMWPPNSPDLNPVDYAVCGALQQMVYRRRRFTSVEQLKDAIITEWDKLSQRFIDRAINQRRCWLECVVQQQGWHIEHCF